MGSNKIFSSGLGSWNGVQWSAFPKKTQTYKLYTNTFIVSSLLNDNGKLWICGSFDSIGGVTCKNICTFDGTTYTPINMPVLTNVGIRQIIKYKNEFYFSGLFYNASSLVNAKIIKYNPSTNIWSSVGIGLNGGYSSIQNMLVYNDTLYLGGAFNKANGNAGNHLMKWDGTQLLDAGFGNFYDWGAIYQLLEYKNRLYAFGSFTHVNDKKAFGKAYYEKGKWVIDNDSMSGGITAGAVVYKDNIFIAGGFSSINGDTSIRNFAKLRCPNFDGCATPEILTEPILPQLITANADGVNDEIIIQLPNTQSATLRVFNRWGNEVYSNNQTANNPNKTTILKWDGTYNNKPLPSGTYFYIVESINLNNEQKNYKQFVELIR